MVLYIWEDKHGQIWVPGKGVCFELQKYWHIILHSGKLSSMIATHSTNLRYVAPLHFYDIPPFVRDTMNCPDGMCNWNRGPRMRSLWKPKQESSWFVLNNSMWMAQAFSSCHSKILKHDMNHPYHFWFVTKQRRTTFVLQVTITIVHLSLLCSVYTIMYRLCLVFSISCDHSFSLHVFHVDLGCFWSRLQGHTPTLHHDRLSVYWKYKISNMQKYAICGEIGKNYLDCY